VAKKPSFAEVEKLVARAILPFYHLERDISTPPPTRRLENDAEHSWSLSLLACALAPHVDPALDVGLVAQLATVHDVVEIYAGDTSILAPKAVLETKEEREREALKRIQQEFVAFPWPTYNYSDLSAAGCS
jgi:5'-deoxynucleotidase YfbR-like HD superfamily hydrolase